jgi:oligopeptide transport system ATP-binding protein
LDENKIRLLRKKMQFIFQDPFSSLNPRMTINEIIGRPMKIFNLYDNEDRKNRIKDILDMVGLSPQHMSRYPHEFSGGQRQRISIARALAVEPEFIIADEPTAALDVSIQCQILNLLIKIKEELGLTVMFISHDLGVINHISDRTAVMYLGKIVEIGPKILKRPIYP